MEQGWELVEDHEGNDGGNWSTVSKEGKRSFCPFCGSDLWQAEPIPGVSAEVVRSDKSK